MSLTTKFDQFTLKIREKGKRDALLNFNDIAGFKLIDEIFNYLQKNIYLFKIDNESERTTRIEKNELIENSLYCRIKVGKFGEASEIVDTVSGSGIFHKEKAHSDTIPLFFHINVVNNGEMAVINAQRVGNRTIVPEIRSIIGNVLQNLREDQFSFELKPLKEVVTLSDFISGNRGRISSINFTINGDESDFFEPLVIRLKLRNRTDLPKDLVKKIVKTSKTGNMALLNDLLPEQLVKTGIKSATAELIIPNRGKVKVKLTDNISISNSLIIQSSEKDRDKYGHLSYNYLKEISGTKLSD